MTDAYYAMILEQPPLVPQKRLRVRKMRDWEPMGGIGWIVLADYDDRRAAYADLPQYRHWLAEGRDLIATMEE